MSKLLYGPRVLPWFIDSQTPFPAGRRMLAWDAYLAALAMTDMIYTLSEDKSRTGGAVLIADAVYDLSPRIWLHAPLGFHIHEKLDEKRFYSLEKARRLNKMHWEKGHWLASRSANEADGRYAGGAMSGSLRGPAADKCMIITTSGWKPMLDEAYALGLHIRMGSMTERRALQLADGANPYLVPLLDLMKKAA